MLLVASAVGTVCWLGCGGDDNNPADNNGNNNTGNNTTHTHDWGAWEVTTPATCEAAGVETRTCKLDASHKETQSIPKLTGAACNPNGGDPYETVTIGGLKWMKKNLNVETANSWCYENSPDSCAKYGKLYTWDAAKIACQSIGWRLPDTNDWNRLVSAAGGQLTAGIKLKATSGWNEFYDGQSGGGNGTNETGFSALPGGYRHPRIGFVSAGYKGIWWTASVDSDAGVSFACSREMYHDYDFVGYSGSDMESSFGSDIIPVEGDGFSVRCVK